MWGWDWDHQTYSREGYGSLGNGNLETSEFNAKKNDTPWLRHGRDPITPPLCLRFWNWSMWPCVASSWQLMRKVPWNENESKTDCLFLLLHFTEGQTWCSVVQLSISLKMLKKPNSLLFCFFLVCLHLQWRWGVLEDFAGCLVNVDFVTTFFLFHHVITCFFGGLIGPISLVFRVSIYQHFQVGVPSLNPKGSWTDTLQRNHLAPRLEGAGI